MNSFYYPNYETSIKNADALPFHFLNLIATNFIVIIIMTNLPWPSTAGKELCCIE